MKTTFKISNHPTKRTCFGCGKPMPRHSMRSNSETDRLLCKKCRCLEKAKHLMFRNDLYLWIQNCPDARDEFGKFTNWAMSLMQEFIKPWDTKEAQLTMRQLRNRHLAQEYTKILRKPCE